MSLWSGRAGRGRPPAVSMTGVPARNCDRADESLTGPGLSVRDAMAAGARTGECRAPAAGSGEAS